MFNHKIKKELAVAKNELVTAKNETMNLRRDLKEKEFTTAEFKKTKKELSTVKKLVREQTEADILVNAFKAVGIIKEDEKKPKTHYLNNHEAHQRQLAQMGEAQGASTGLGGLLRGCW